MYDFRRAVNIIEPTFKEMCVEEQNMLGTEDGVTKFLGMFGEDDLRSEVKSVLDKYSTSIKKWEAFVNFFKDQIQSVSHLDDFPMKNLINNN